MASPMGHDSSQPVTASDKAMSKRHKEHRKEIEKMRESPEKYEKSIKYNAAHRDEHGRALIKAKHDLKKIKLTVKFNKR
jgi:hypothetical protein